MGVAKGHDKGKHVESLDYSLTGLGQFMMDTRVVYPNNTSSV